MNGTTVSLDEKNNRKLTNGTNNFCAQIISPGHIGFVNTPIPEIGHNEILIRMEGCGVCGSNLPLWEGRPWFSYPLEPGSPGHEGWGRVVATGKDVDRFKVGDRVAALSFHAFALFDKVDQSNAVLIPEELDQFPFPGEALGCAMNVWARAQIEPGQRIAIIGVGFLGGLLCQLAGRFGVSAVAISRRRFALETAEKCGIKHTCLLGELSEIVESVNRIFESGCDCVIEAAGFQYTLTVASALVKNSGRLIIAGYHQDGMRQIDMQQWNWKCIDVINAHERDPMRYIQGINAAVEAVADKRLEPQLLYSHVLPFEKLGEAFELMKNRPDGFMKALVTL
jgi:threonine dehydrogenase-like Zn-dependent dehydrogenase